MSNTIGRSKAVPVVHKKRASEALIEHPLLTTSLYANDDPIDSDCQSAIFSAEVFVKAIQFEG